MLFRKKATLPAAAFDFNAAVKETYNNFPALKRKALFYDAANNKLRGENPFLKIWMRLTRIKKKSGNRGRVISKFGDRARTMVFAPGDGDFVYKMGGGSFVFDHELGHILNPETYFPKDPPSWVLYDLHAHMVKHECASDAYAVIRHFQRHGIDSDDVPKLAVYRSWEVVQSGGVGNHLSSSMIGQIWADRHKVDFLSLSPAETWQKAQEYAQKYAPDRNDMRLLDRSYNYNMYKFGEGTLAPVINSLEFLELIATTCLTTPNNSVFLVGAGFIVPLITSASPTLTDPDWLKVVDKIQGRAHQFGLLSSMDMFRLNSADISRFSKSEKFDEKKQQAVTARLLKL